MTVKKKIFLLTLTGIMVAGSIMGCGTSDKASVTAAQSEENVSEEASENEKSDLKIALLLPGSANDNGWSQMAADAVADAGEKYGCEYNFSESLAPTDYENVMRGYADAGYQIIISHGAQFLDCAKTVAAEYPDTRFIVTSCLEGVEPNLTGIDFGSYENGFLTGLACGYASEDGKIGVVCAEEGDTTVLWNEALEKAAKIAHPDAEVTTVYTGSYDDQLKAKQAAEELINQGCDVITENANAAGIGAIQECDDAGICNISSISDYDDEGENVVFSVVQNVSVGLESAVGYAIEGTLDTGSVSLGASAGVNYYTDIKGVMADRISQEEKASLDDYYQKALEGVDFKEY